MALSQGEIDEIIVRITAEAQGYIRALNETQAKTQTWSVAVGTLLGNIATRAFGMLKNAVVGFLRESVSAAGSAAETLSAFNVIFGDQAAVASLEAEQMGKRIARSARDMKEGLVSQQAFFTALGFGAKEAKDLSFRIQELAIDMASFRNTQDADMVNRFRAALSGSTEVLDQFGINIKDSALKQEALEQGITKSTQKMTEQEKVMLRIALITKQMGKAQGDAERTAGSFVNQQKNLNATWDDAKVALGDALIPAINALIPVAKAAADAIGLIADAVSDLSGNIKFLQVNVSDPRIGRMFKDALGQAEADMANFNVTRAKALGMQISLLTDAAFLVPSDTQKQIIKETIKLLEVEIAKVNAEIEAAVQKVRDENKRIGQLGFKGMFTPDPNEIIDSLRKVARTVHTDPVLGKHGLLGNLFFGAGAGLNEFQKIMDDLKQTQTQTIRQTGGQAVRAGTSEAISLTRIGQRTVSENQRRDSLLAGIKEAVGKGTTKLGEILVAVKQSGVDVAGVEIP